MALGKVSTWNCIAHDLTSYRAYMRSLPVMPSESESSEGGYFTMFKKEKKGKGKAKKVDRLGGDVSISCRFARAILMSPIGNGCC